MINNLSKFVAFLGKYGITSHQFMLPYMLYLDEKVTIDGVTKYPNNPDEGRPIASLYQYMEQCRGWTPSEIKQLEDAGLLENDNPTVVDNGGPRKQVSPDLMRPSELFKSTIFAPMDRWEEFVEAYPVTVPNFHNPDGPEIPLQMVGEPGAWEALEEFYNKRVKSKILHEEILELVQWGRKNGYINMNISKFVASRHWDTLRQLREKSNKMDADQLSPEMRQL